MPEGGGIAAAEGIRTSSPATRVVALSAYEDEARMEAMRGAGAVAYVVKGAPANDILERFTTPPAHEVRRALGVR